MRTRIWDRAVHAELWRPSARLCPGGRIFLKRRVRGIRGRTAQKRRENKSRGHAFFCNFLLTKGLTQFNMAVDKTRNEKEVGEKPTIIVVR